jgi:hypothetical protein
MDAPEEDQSQCPADEGLNKGLIQAIQSICTEPKTFSDSPRHAEKGYLKVEPMAPCDIHRPVVKKKKNRPNDAESKST